MAGMTIKQKKHATTTNHRPVSEGSSLCSVCPAIILSRQSDCKTFGFSRTRTTTSTRTRSMAGKGWSLCSVQKRQPGALATLLGVPDRHRLTKFRSLGIVLVLVVVLVLGALAFGAGKDPGCPAIILFRQSDCKTFGFSRTRTTTSTRTRSVAGEGSGLRVLESPDKQSLPGQRC
jgi:hypothetical protein